MKPENRIHNHPKMERDKELDENHVIIDKKLYLELLEKYGDLLKPLRHSGGLGEGSFHLDKMLRHNI